MSDQNVTDETTAPDAEAVAPAAPEVTAQDAKTVGDEAVAEATAENGVQVEVNKDEVAAQVVQPRESDPAQVAVHEVHVQTDTVITDPSSPLAVQVPDAGRGSLDLPIHSLSEGTVEDRFKEAE